MVDSRGSCGGLMLLWKGSCSVMIRYFSGTHIDSVFCNGKISWHFIGLYGNPYKALRHRSWNLLRCLADGGGFPWVMSRDEAISQPWAPKACENYEDKSVM